MIQKSIASSEKHCSFHLTCRFSMSKLSFIHVQNPSRRLFSAFVKLLLLFVKVCLSYIGRGLQVVRERRNTGMKEVRNFGAFIAIVLRVCIV